MPSEIRQVDLFRPVKGQPLRDLFPDGTRFVIAKGSTYEAVREGEELFADFKGVLRVIAPGESESTHELSGLGDRPLRLKQAGDSTPIDDLWVEQEYLFVARRRGPAEMKADADAARLPGDGQEGGAIADHPAEPERPVAAPAAVATRRPFTPTGYFFANEVQGGLGTRGGGVSPKRKGRQFMVVVGELPAGQLMPDEATFQADLADGKFDSYDSKTRTDVRPKGITREHVLYFDPTRFEMSISGSEYPGDLIADWRQLESATTSGMGFGGGFTSRQSDAHDPESTLQVGVAFILPIRDCKLPAKIRFADGDSIDVAEALVEPPPIRRSLF